MEYKHRKAYLLYFYVGLIIFPVILFSLVIFYHKATSVPIADKSLEFNLSSESTPMSFTPYLWMKREKKGENLSYQDILALSKNLEENFEFQGQTSLGFGHTSDKFWFYCKLNNYSDSEDFYLSLDYPLLENVKIYLFQNNKLVEHSISGTSQKFYSRPVTSRNVSFPIKLPVNKSTEILISVDTQTYMQIHFKLWTKSQYVFAVQRDYFIFGFYYGIIIFMIAYNVIIWLGTKDINYLYFGIYILFFMFFLMNAHGFSLEFFWPSHPALVNIFMPLSMLMTAITAIIFTRSFLKTRYLIPKMDLILRIMLLVSLFLIIFTLVFMRTGYQIALRIASFIVITTIFLILGAGYMTFNRGYKFARYYIVSWLVLDMGVLIYAFSSFDILPVNVISLNSAQLGSAIQVLFLSLALTDQIKQEKKEKENAQYNLISFQKTALDYQTKLINAYSKFVPYQFLELLNKKEITDVKLGDQVLKKMTVLFSDIRDFTSLSESMTPKENFNFLNSYLKRMCPLVPEYKGIIDKYLGDGIMALFPDDAANAIRAAAKMQEELIIYNNQRHHMNYQEISVGIGIHSGSLILGTIGEEDRMDTTVISDAVNISSRLVGLTKIFDTKIIFTNSALDNSSSLEDLNYRYLGKIKVLGKSKPIEIFELLDVLESEDFTRKMSYKKDFEKAIAFFQLKKINESFKIIKNYEKFIPTDKALKYFYNKCEYYIKNGIPNNWDGAEAIDKK